MSPRGLNAADPRRRADLNRPDNPRPPDPVIAARDAA
jgi:hypothetical protein